MPERPPAPAPRPIGELLRHLDPERAAHDAEVAALNKMVEAGKIDWQEWARRVRVLREESAAARPDELAEARAAAAEARAARDRVEAARQHSNDQRER
jgi:hypothetical protein